MKARARAGERLIQNKHNSDLRSINAFVAPREPDAQPGPGEYDPCDLVPDGGVLTRARARAGEKQGRESAQKLHVEIRGLAALPLLLSLLLRLLLSARWRRA